MSSCFPNPVQQTSLGVRLGGNLNKLNSLLRHLRRRLFTQMTSESRYKNVKNFSTLFTSEVNKNDLMIVAFFKRSVSVQYISPLYCPLCSIHLQHLEPIIEPSAITWQSSSRYLEHRDRIITKTVRLHRTVRDRYHSSSSALEMSWSIINKSKFQSFNTLIYDSGNRVNCLLQVYQH